MGFGKLLSAAGSGLFVISMVVALPGRNARASEPAPDPGAVIFSQRCSTCRRRAPGPGAGLAGVAADARIPLVVSVARRDLRPGLALELTITDETSGAVRRRPVRFVAPGL